MLNYFDVVVTILNIEPLTALGPVEEGHMVLLSKPVSESLAAAVLWEADVEQFLFSKLDQLLIAENLANCSLNILIYFMIGQIN